MQGLSGSNAYYDTNCIFQLTAALGSKIKKKHSCVTS